MKRADGLVIRCPTSVLNGPQFESCNHESFISMILFGGDSGGPWALIGSRSLKVDT